MGFDCEVLRFAIIQIVLVRFYLFSKRIHLQVFKINIFDTLFLLLPPGTDILLLGKHARFPLAFPHTKSLFVYFSFFHNTIFENELLPFFPENKRLFLLHSVHRPVPP